MLNLAPIRVLPPHLRREALEATLRVCAPDEADAIVAALLHGPGPRRRLQTLASAAIAWERLSPENQRRLLRYAGRRLSVLVENLSASPDPRRRRAAARLTSVSRRDAAIATLARLVADPEQYVAVAAAEEITALAVAGSGECSTETEQLLVRAAEHFHSHRRSEPLREILARVARPGPALDRWLDDEGQPAHMAIRSMLRRDDSPGARAAAVVMLARPSFSPAACDRLRKADSVAEHDSALSRWPLLRHPRRRRALARVADAAPLLPAEIDIPDLSADARLGRVHLIRALRLSGPARAAALAPCLADEAVAPRLATVATLGAGPLTEPEADLLADLMFDQDARVARSAAAALFAAPAADADRWTHAARSPHADVRDLAALAPSVDPLATPASARLWLLAEPDRFIIVLRARIARAPAPDRVHAISICSRLGMAPRAELELLAAAADADPRVASAAARALGAVPSVTAKEVVVRLADHADHRVRANAVEAARGRPGVAAMIEAKLADPHHRVRSGALLVWADAAPDLVAERLREMLLDERPAERLAALWATRSALLTDLAPEVARCARDGDTPGERRSAARCARSLLLASRPVAVPFRAEPPTSGGAWEAAA